KHVCMANRLHGLGMDGILPLRCFLELTFGDPFAGFRMSLFGEYEAVIPYFSRNAIAFEQTIDRLWGCPKRGLHTPYHPYTSKHMFLFLSIAYRENVSRVEK